MFGMPEWLYVVACIVAPLGVGLAMYVGFGAWDRRRRKGAQQAGLPPVDYSI